MKMQKSWTKGRAAPVEETSAPVEETSALVEETSALMEFPKNHIAQFPH
jgi:glycyl-tRNA synthetase beta subunit